MTGPSSTIPTDRLEAQHDVAQPVGRSIPTDGVVNEKWFAQELREIFRQHFIAWDDSTDWEKIGRKARAALSIQTTSGKGKAAAPLQPATGFINAIADRFQEAHTTPLTRDKALLLALTTLADAEADLGPINHPDFDWSLDGALVIANENIEHWEQPSA